MQGGLPCCLQSLLRRDGKVRPGEPYGNLLKAGTERTLETINVEFTGTTTVDPATGMTTPSPNAKSIFFYYMAVSHNDCELLNPRNRY